MLFEESQGQGIIFRNLIPGQGSFSYFPAAPPRMFVDQVPLPAGYLASMRNCIFFIVQREESVMI